MSKNNHETIHPTDDQGSTESGDIELKIDADGFEDHINAGEK